MFRCSRRIDWLNEIAIFLVMLLYSILHTARVCSLFLFFFGLDTNKKCSYRCRCRSKKTVTYSTARRWIFGGKLQQYYSFLLVFFLFLF